MNDKQQLAAMGTQYRLTEEQAKGLAERMPQTGALQVIDDEPLCMAKRIEEPEAQVRVMAGLLREARPYIDHRGGAGVKGYTKLTRDIDAALAGKLPEPVYYMRDNHTFKRLSNDVDTAITEIEVELDAGWTSGMLCSKRKGFSSLHANYRRPREDFISDCRDAMLAAAPKPEAK